MEKIEIEVKPRDIADKKVHRNLNQMRAQGLIPAVIYGRGREPEALALDTTALTRLLTEIAAATTLVDVRLSRQEHAHCPDVLLELC